MKEVLLLVSLLAFVLPITAQAEGWKPARLPRKRHKFVVVAHRGNHVHAPENTLEALQNAITAEVDYVEIDLRTTRDGHIVIMHDSTVDRMTDGKGKVADMTLAEFRALHIVDRRFPQRAPEPPPTFEEILQHAQGKIYLYLDAKAVDPKQVWELLLKYKMEHSVVVYCGDDEIEKWRKPTPKLPLMISPPDESKRVEVLESFWKSHQVEILDGGYYTYTRENVEIAKQWHVEVWADIQSPLESPEQWNKALETGMQGLQTDHPEQLIAYLKKIKKR